MTDIKVEPFDFGHVTKRFIEVGHRVYRDDPNWVAPLELDMGDRLNPKKNPFFQHAEGVIFLASRNGVDIGRITAQIDHEHLKKYDDGVGFFGYLDTINDAEVAKALLDEAASWLKKKGMKAMRGPMSLSINEEIGVLVEGFDTPPVVLMPHHRDYHRKKKMFLPGVTM
jgi:hypothetical protein